MTAADVEANVQKAFVGEARDLEGVSRQRSYAHRSACNAWNVVNYTLGVPAVVLAAVAGATALQHHTGLAAGLALSAGVVSALATFLNPSQTARLHQQAAASYGELQGTFRRFHQIDTLVESDVAKLRAELETAVKQFNGVDAASPPIPWWSRHRHHLDTASRVQRIEPG
jgi:hypothetical protein